MGHGSIGVYVNISLDDAFSEIGDDDLLKEIERRCLTVARTVEEAKADSFTPLVEEALELLCQRRFYDARLTLERALFPKWKAPEDAFRALQRRSAA